MHQKSLSCWQLASVAVNEGDEACTTNLCQMCFNKHMQTKGEKTTAKCEVEAGCGKEGVSGKNVENDGKRTISAWDVGTSRKGYPLSPVLRMRGWVRVFHDGPVQVFSASTSRVQLVSVARAAMERILVSRQLCSRRLSPTRGEGVLVTRFGAVSLFLRFVFAAGVPQPQSLDVLNETTLEALCGSVALPFHNTLSHIFARSQLASYLQGGDVTSDWTVSRYAFSVFLVDALACRDVRWRSTISLGGRRQSCRMRTTCNAFGHETSGLFRVVV